MSILSKISLATFSSIMGKLLNKKQVEEDQFISAKAQERDNFLKQFPYYINSAKQIVIFPHVNPDGDCLGGAFGMRETLRAQFPDKNIYVVGTSQGIFPWLEMDFDEIPLDFDYSSSLALIVDSGTSERVQKFQDFFGSPETQKWGAVIRVDHHDNKQDYHTDLSWVDTSYAACCAQLVQICDYYQWEMTKRAATFFYLGLLTDSGFFSNADVSPRTFVISAKALRAGADREFLISNLKRIHSQEARLKGYILENYVQEDRFAWFFVKNEAVEKFKPYSLTSNQISTLSNIDDNLLWIIMLEVSSTEIRVSFRSVGTLDVRKIAEEFGGGGHINASGTTLTSADQVKVLISRARKLVKEFIESGGETSKDVLVDQAKEEFDKQINPSYRFDFTPEEKSSLDQHKELLEQTHDSLASHAKIKEAESIVNSDQAFDTFLSKPEIFSTVKEEEEDNKEISSAEVKPALDDSDTDDSL